MNYQIGDILMVRNKGPLSWIIRFITRSDWNHCGIFVSSNTIVEATFRGVFKSDIEKFTEKRNRFELFYEVFRVRNIKQTETSTAGAFALSKVGAKYDEVQLARMFLMYVLHIPRRIRIPDSDIKWICSELVAQAFEKAGIILNPRIRPDNMVPGDFTKSPMVEKVQ
jgi:uncharacterized protein YycO